MHRWQERAARAARSDRRAAGRHPRGGGPGHGGAVPGDLSPRCRAGRQGAGLPRGSAGCGKARRRDLARAGEPRHAGAAAGVLRRHRCRRLTREGGSRADEVAVARHPVPGGPRDFPGAEGDVPPRRDTGDDLDPAKRHHQDLLGGGGHLPAADAGRLDLRDELPGDARTRMGHRLSDGDPDDDRVGSRVLLGFQDFGVGCSAELHACDAASNCARGSGADALRNVGRRAFRSSLRRRPPRARPGACPPGPNGARRRGRWRYRRYAARRGGSRR